MIESVVYASERTFFSVKIFWKPKSCELVDNAWISFMMMFGIAILTEEEKNICL